MPLAPQSPPEAGEREAKAICCLPRGVENPGTSSLLEVRHELTYLVVPVIGRLSLVCWVWRVSLRTRKSAVDAWPGCRRFKPDAVTTCLKFGSVGEPFRSRSKNLTTPL